MQFTVTTRDSVTHEVEGRPGISLMQSIRNGGIDELQAICGGALSCATCHVYIEDLPAGVELPAKSRDEEDLLDSSDFLEEHSRLSCQLTFDAGLQGMRVTVAPED
ncbi:2Fe-2S iron-sulfur cluster binding domain-containing protein [Arthrobacter bambusae]|uniref:2Fe-2S iron-sulfur cluster-binding protein n=1 Tax=Arthrobacter bambusae TaxID=1338426 RepID=UPI001F512DD3|nr:2Fe-2S iron-sulfur cluster-binding protein [Arthrobacter bambusae]MCI0142653.1 2Fe-2S iron-sulfur cluster binding domain-containing protein [Arthrobacter bambusae]